MTLSYAVTMKNSRLDQITSAISTSGLLRIYDGSVPTNADTALGAQVLLAELALSSAFAPGASSGVLTASAITSDTSANATGTATFFRLVTSGGTSKVQGTVGTSGQDLNLNTVSIVAAATVAVSSMVITSGN
jgi:hypothetical protein